MLGSKPQGIARLGRVNDPVNALVVEIRRQGSLRRIQSFSYPTIPQNTNRKPPSRSPFRCFSRRLRRQHLSELLLRAARPTLPSGNLDRPTAGANVFRVQRVATFFWNQRPVRSATIMTTTKFFRTLTAMGRAILEPPVHLFSFQGLAKSSQQTQLRRRPVMDVNV